MPLDNKNLCGFGIFNKGLKGGLSINPTHKVGFFYLYIPYETRWSRHECRDHPPQWESNRSLTVPNYDEWNFMPTYSGDLVAWMGRDGDPKL